MPDRITRANFFSALQEQVGLREEEIPCIPTTAAAPRPYRPFRRYTIGMPTPEEVALSLRPRSYLSHASALRVLGIPERTGPAVYANQEQSPKPLPRGELTQHSIDRAFQNGARVSRYVFDYHGTPLVLLTGKHTQNYRVTNAASARHHGGLPVTDIPRTLVDVTVRPAYAGGPDAVLAAYRFAIRKMDSEALVAELIETLDVVAHVYPFHQAIGFYLERAGLPAARLTRLRQRGVNYDFYLSNQIENAAYNPSWRIYAPPGLAIG